MSISIKLSKIVIHEFWYDYVKPKCREKANLCYMDTGSFIVYIKIEDIYREIAKDVETRFDTSIYELEKTITCRKKPKEIRLIKNELSGKIIKGFAVLRVKTYSYLKDNKDQKAKRIKKCVVKQKRKSEDNKNCLEATRLEQKKQSGKNMVDEESAKENNKEFIKNDKIILKSQQRFTSETHNTFKIQYARKKK